MSNETIINLFKKLKLDFEKVFLNKKSFDDHDFIEFEIKPIIKNIINKIEKLPKNNFLNSEINQWIEEIEYYVKKTTNKRKRISFKELETALLNFQTEIVKPDFLIIPISDVAEMDKADLTEDEIILLFLYLRDLKLIDKVNDTIFSMSINVLSGQSYKQIQKKIYGKNKTDKYLISDKQPNYDKLSNKLSAIIDKIKKDRLN